jgi:GNAT superfamily N-acetyltransferase
LQPRNSDIAEGIEPLGEPRNYRAWAKLKDDCPVLLRAIRPDDKNHLQEGLHHLSKESQYFRFLTPKSDLSESELVFFTELDFVHHVGLVVSTYKNGVEMPVGVGRYISLAKSPTIESAELAFAVDEEYQGRGAATILLEHLTKIARRQGLTTFTALVHPENIKMLRVFASSGLPLKRKHNEAGTVEITLSLN